MILALVQLIVIVFFFKKILPEIERKAAPKLKELWNRYQDIRASEIKVDIYRLLLDIEDKALTLRVLTAVTAAGNDREALTRIAMKLTDIKTKTQKTG